MALGRVREVYGVRRVVLDEADKTVRVEYDATRLTEAIIHQLLRRSGLDIVIVNIGFDPWPAWYMVEVMIDFNFAWQKALNFNVAHVCTPSNPN